MPAGVVVTVGLNPMPVIAAVATFEGPVLLVGSQESLGPLRTGRGWSHALGRNRADRITSLELPPDPDYAATSRGLEQQDMTGWDLAYAGGTAGMAAAAVRRWCKANPDTTEADAWYLDRQDRFRGLSGASVAAKWPALRANDVIHLHDPHAHCGLPQAVDQAVLEGLRAKIDGNDWAGLDYHELKTVLLLDLQARRIDVTSFDYHRWWSWWEGSALHVGGAQPATITPNDPVRRFRIGEGKRTFLRLYERSVKVGGAHAHATLLFPASEGRRAQVEGDIKDLEAHSQGRVHVEVRGRQFLRDWLNR